MSQTPDDPTPEQIRAACLLIQASWTPAERRKRLRSDWRGSEGHVPNSEPVDTVKAGRPENA